MEAQVHRVDSASAFRGASTDPHGPDDRARHRALYLLAAALLLLTTLTPLIQVGAGRVRMSPRDVGVAMISISAWIPVFLVVARLVGVRRGRWVFWTAHIAIGVSGLLAHTAIVLASDAWLSGRAVASALSSEGLAWAVLMALGMFQYLALLALLLTTRTMSAAEDTRKRSAALEAERAQLQAQLDRARIDALRAKLQPHFLFNTLNSILVLAPADPAGAQTMIRQLSELLRAAIADDGTTTIPLRRELELIDAYLAIQGVRFEARLRVSREIDPNVLEYGVPPFLLQPLVENAIHHAVAPREGGGSLGIAAARTANRLKLTVTDDGPGCDSDDAGPRGLGLRGSQARLAHACGPDATITLARARGGGCVVHLDLPLMRSTG